MIQLKKNQNKSEEEKLEIVNKFYNEQIKYESDIIVWGMIDYWATPIESLNKGYGDCEDYAIGKYFALKKMGIYSFNDEGVYLNFKDSKINRIVSKWENLIIKVKKEGW